MTVSFCLEDKLIEAQTKAARLFEETEKRGLIAVGISEKELNEKIHDLAQEMFGLKNTGISASCVPASMPFVPTVKILLI